MEEIKKESSKISTQGAIILAGVIIAGSILMSSLGQNKKEVAKAPNNDNLANVLNDSPIYKVKEEDHFRGNKNAKIVVIEYSDTECPFCKNFHETMLRIIKENPNDVAWVYRHFPLSIHPKAIKEAVALECAGSLGGNDVFNSYLDKVFEITPSNNNLEEGKLYSIASDLKLDKKSFSDCLNSDKFNSKIEESIKGAATKVQGTPTSFIIYNGKFTTTIPGAYPYEDVSRAISEILKSK